MQADGTLRLVVSATCPDQRVGEILSFVLDQEGESREQRPFDGKPVRFAPIGAGHWRVRLVGRIRARPARAGAGRARAAALSQRSAAHSRAR